jgi:hypothetical protein
MIGTNCDLFTHKSSRSYLNHHVIHSYTYVAIFMVAFVWLYDFLLPGGKFMAKEVSVTSGPQRRIVNFLLESPENCLPELTDMVWLANYCRALQRGHII